MKKKLMKSLCMLLSVLMLTSAVPVTASAATETFTEGYYTYYVQYDVAVISSVNTAISGNITIPTTLGGYEVAYIPAYAYRGSCSHTAYTHLDYRHGVLPCYEHCFIQCSDDNVRACRYIKNNGYV